MREEVVAIALEIVANEGVVVAVRDETDSLGQDRILNFNLFESDWTLLARDLGKAGDLVDQFALSHASQRKCVFGSEWQAVENRRQRETDQRHGE
jgi:hypothetical protein